MTGDPKARGMKLAPKVLSDEERAALPAFLESGPNGKRVRREDVDRLTDRQRIDLWYVDENDQKRFPWSHEEAMFAHVPKPAMTRLQLRGLGLDDAKLQAMRVEEFGPPLPGEVALDGEMVDTREQMELRREVFDAVMGKRHGPEPEVR